MPRKTTLGVPVVHKSQFCRFGYTVRNVPDGLLQVGSDIFEGSRGCSGGTALMDRVFI